MTSQSGTIEMAKVYAILDGAREFWGLAKDNRDLFQFTDDIESLGLQWDFDLV